MQGKNLDGKNLDAALHWLSTYAKLKEEDCYMIISAARSRVGPGELELFIYWVKVLGLSFAGVKNPESIIRHPYAKRPGRRTWTLTWF